MESVMTSTTTTSKPAGARPVPPLLYPTLLIAGIVVIIASMLGIAAMTGLLPQAQSNQSVSEQTSVPASAAVQGGKEGKVASRAQTTPAQTTASRAASPKSVATAARCDECGVVDAIRAIDTKGEGSGVGAVAGGVVGGILGNQVGGGRGRTAMTVVGAGAGAYAGHEIEKNMNKSVSYEVRVRMDDNSYRTFRTQQPDVGVGQRVKVRDGQLVRAG